MGRVQSIEPVIGRDPRVIILGSMPGIISINAAQYYANPRNIFWMVLSELFDINIDCSYEARIQQLYELPIILWDTLKACHREGSLDSKILNTDIEANDIVSLLDQYQSVRAIVFNGAASAKFFNQLVKPEIPDERNIQYLKMPSTSPANASIKYDQKVEIWRSLLAYV